MAKVIRTDDSLEYVFFPLVHGSLQFKVKAKNDAHVALATDTAEDSRIYEIFLGGWGNTKSAIYCDHQQPNKVIAETPNIVAAAEEREFWVHWNNGNIQVGYGGQSAPFLEYNDPNPFPIGCYGVRTSWGSTGKWLVEDHRRIKTPDSVNYQFWPVPCGAVTVDVRCQSNAHIALISSKIPAHYEAHPYMEVLIGEQENSYSAIRRDGAKPDRVTAETHRVVTDFTYRRFRVRWNNGEVSVVPGGTASTPILEYNDPDPVGVTYIGVRTTAGSKGHWRIKEGDEPGCCPEFITTEWVRVTSGKIPTEAFIGGKDHYSNLYVGQAYHEGDLLPGKVHPKDKLCYVPWRGEEVVKREYQVLCGTELEWVSCSSSNIPTAAVRGGRTEYGEVLYIGRVPHSNTITIGKKYKEVQNILTTVFSGAMIKVHPSHGACYIPYKGSELKFPNYEILIYKLS